MADFRTYQTFIAHSAAEDIIHILQENNIPYELENNDHLGSNIVDFNAGTQQVALKLRTEDFAVADALIEKTALEQIPLLEEDYHLFSYSKEELLDIVSKPDEWSKFDYYIAKHLLIAHNNITTENIETLKEVRIEELSKPEFSSPKWLKFRYFFALGGVPGIILGLVIYTHKKTLPNGQTIHTYSYDDRKKGLSIILISTVFLIAYTCLSIYARYSRMD